MTVFIFTMLGVGCGESELPSRHGGPRATAHPGQAEFRAQGCAQCHTIDGSRNIGPTLRDVYGSMRPLEDGRTVLADEDYLRRSILDHSAEVVEGYPDVGPNLVGQINAEQLDRLVDFLRSISQHTTDEPAPETLEPEETETQPG